VLWAAVYWDDLKCHCSGVLDCARWLGRDGQLVQAEVGSCDLGRDS
jgi:hypothetical protein